MEVLVFAILGGGAGLDVYLSYSDPDTARDWKGFLKVDDSTAYILNTSPPEIAILDMNDSEPAILVRKLLVRG